MGSLGRHRRRMHGTARSVRRTGRNRSDAQSVGGTPPIREPDWLERLVGEIGTLFKDCLGTPEVQEEPPLKGILKWPSKESSTDSASSSDNEKKAIDGNKGGPPRRITFNQAIQVSRTLGSLQSGESCRCPSVRCLATGFSVAMNQTSAAASMTLEPRPKNGQVGRATGSVGEPLCLSLRAAFGSLKTLPT